MQVAIERRPGSVVALTLTVEPAVLEQQKERMFQKYARRVTIPGFRAGKAPRRLVEERIDQNRLQQEAIEAVIEITYKQALDETKIEPLDRGEVEDLDVADDQTMTFTVLVSVRPEVKLDNYIGLTVPKPVTQVTDEQIAGEIEQLRERTADYREITDDGIQTGDYVTIDYTMTVDGNPYPEGDATGYPLEVGTDTFFPELNEALLGVKQDETTKVTTHYADDYSNKELAGKTAEFDITVQQVRRVVKPDANDEWAQMLSQGTLSTMEELRTRIRENLQAMAARSDKEQLRNHLVSLVVAGAELEIPDTLADEEYEHLMHEMEHQLSHQRMTLEEYAEAVEKTVDLIRQEQQVMARDMVRRSLVLQEVARREHLFVTNEEMTGLLQATLPPNTTLANFRKELEKSGKLNSLASRLFHEKVLAFLEEHANIESEGETETSPAPETPDTPTAE